MLVRHFRAGDETAIATVYNQAFRNNIESFPAIYRYRNIESTDVLSWLDQGSHMIWVITSEDQIVGYAQVRIEIEHGKKDIPVLQFTPAHSWDLNQSNIAVLPEYQKQGFGTALAKRILEEFCRTAEVASALVFSDNIAGENLFTKLGFTMHDVYHYSDYSDEKPLTNSSIYESIDLDRFSPPMDLNQDVRFRRAIANDANDIAEIHMHNVWWCEVCSTIDWSLNYIAGNYGHTVFVAEYNDNVVGTIDYFRDGRIGIAGVLPEYKKQGIGSKMFSEILMKMREKGFSSGFVDSGLTQTEAIKMYERFGLTIERRQNSWVKELR